MQESSSTQFLATLLKEKGAKSVVTDIVVDNAKNASVTAESLIRTASSFDMDKPDRWKRFSSEPCLARASSKRGGRSSEGSSSSSSSRYGSTSLRNRVAGSDISLLKLPNRSQGGDSGSRLTRSGAKNASKNATWDSFDFSKPKKTNSKTNKLQSLLGPDLLVNTNGVKNKASMRRNSPSMIRGAKPPSSGPKAKVNLLDTALVMPSSKKANPFDAIVRTTTNMSAKPNPFDTSLVMSTTQGSNRLPTKKPNPFDTTLVLPSSSNAQKTTNPLDTSMVMPVVGPTSVPAAALQIPKPGRSSMRTSSEPTALRSSMARSLSPHRDSRTKRSVTIDPTSLGLIRGQDAAAPSSPKPDRPLVQPTRRRSETKFQPQRSRSMSPCLAPPLEDIPSRFFDDESKHSDDESEVSLERLAGEYGSGGMRPAWLPMSDREVKKRDRSLSPSIRRPSMPVSAPPEADPAAA